MPEQVSISYLAVLLVYLTEMQPGWMQVRGTLLVRRGAESVLDAIKTVPNPAVFAGALPKWRVLVHRNMKCAQLVRCAVGKA
ncbi:MAG: hypothetical protein Q7U78_00740 [Gallionella sp.]|nr:hypothetical protein [Gallionella sp.]